MYRAELEDRVVKEGALHDKLHEAMVKNERETEKAVAKLNALAKRKRANIKVVFRPGKEARRIGGGPKLTIKPRTVTDSQLDEAIEGLRLEFGEYKDKWGSHKGSDNRLSTAVNNLKKHERRMDQTAERLSRAQDSLARATEAQAKQARKEAKLKTPGYVETRRLLAKQVAETKREKIESETKLRQARETARAQQIEAKEKKRKDKEARLASEFAERARKYEAVQQKQEDQKLSSFDKGLMALRRPFEVRVRQHQRKWRL
jgi:hypothetical protein